MENVHSEMSNVEAKVKRVISAGLLSSFTMVIYIDK